MTTEDIDPIEELMAACLARPEPEQDEALARLVAEHPEHAGEIASRLAVLRAVGLAGPPPASGSGPGSGGGGEPRASGEGSDGGGARDVGTDRTRALPGFPLLRLGPAAEGEDAFPDRLGDFELVERIGGGGMGVVYRARQSSLGREVALKLIRPEHLYFPGARERFRREVEAVARLQHPGIVPVYTVGETRGVPYFAMELVGGATLASVLDHVAGRAPESLTGADLAEVLEALSGGPADGEVALWTGSWVSACLEIVRQVAEALDHAHQRGVLHRDVKPSNIVLTGDGRALLIDFGLTSSTGTDRMTRTGATVGTLLYMAPEQLVTGGEPDPRTDVYALGVTLYELLTLQVPYRGEDRPTTERLVLAGVPDSIRARNRRVPEDAAVVCLEAMDRDPPRRYRSAAAFARDLRHVLDRRPIAARAPGPGLRLRRWAQRHPARCASIVLGLLLLVGTPLALWWQSREYTVELQQQSAALAEQARALSDSSALLEAQHAELQRYAGELEATVEDLRQQTLRGDSGLAFLIDVFTAADPRHFGRDVTIRDVLSIAMERARDSYRDAPRSRALLMLSLAETATAIGMLHEARAFLLEALALVDGLPAAEREVRDTRAGVTGALAQVEQRLGRADEAERLFRESLALYRELHAGEPERHETALASALQALGTFLVAAGRLDEAVATLDESLALTHPMVTGEGGVARLDHREVAVLEAYTLASKAQAHYFAGRLDEAWDTVGLAIEAHRAVEDQSVGLANALATRALLSRQLGRLDRAVADGREAVARLSELVLPGDVLLATTRYNLARALIDHEPDLPGGLDHEQRHARRLAETYGAAEPLLRQAVEVFAEFGGESDGRFVMSRVYLGHCLVAQERWDEAEDLLGPLVEAMAARGESGDALPVALSDLARCREARGDLEGAGRLHVDALASALDRLGEADPVTVRIGERTAENLSRRGLVEQAEALRAELAALR